MRFNWVLLLLVVGLLTESSPLMAGVDRWTPLGPDGGGVTALTYSADGRTAFAGTFAGGVFRSPDGGATWRPASEGLRGQVRDLAAESSASPAAPARLYAATSEGVFRSDDGGAHWSAVNAGLLAVGGRVDASVVAVEPTGAHAVWAAVHGDLLYRSLDRGRTWKVTNPGLRGRIADVAPHPKTPRVVLVATVAGLFRTRDDGRTWRPSGLAVGVARVAFDAVRPEHVYAVTATNGQHGFTDLGVQVSDDGGGHWRPAAGPPLGFDAAGLAVDPFHAGTAWLGVAVPIGSSLWKTTDGGLHWRGVRQSKGFEVVAANPAVPGAVLAGRRDTGHDEAADPPVVRTADGGVTWASAVRGLRALVVWQVAADPAVAGVLYARGDDALWKRDGGGWRRLAGLPTAAPTDLALDPYAPSTLYVASTFRTYKSVDAGETWDELDTPAFASITADPLQRGRVFGALLNEPGLWRSDDGGATWRTLPPLESGRETHTTLLRATNAGLLANGWFFVTEYTDRLRRSTDGGLTWTTVFDTPQPDLFRDVAVDPRDPRRIWTATEEFDSTGRGASGLVEITVDGGHSGFGTSVAGLPVLALALDPRDTRRVYAAAGNAVFASADGGIHWARLGAGLPPTRVLDVEMDPSDPDTLYAATEGGSVYVLTRSDL